MWRGIRRYELSDRIGVGGMAEVFRATAFDSSGRSRKVVLKRILPQFSDDPSYRVMFRDEWRIAARLRHPNVVELLDAGTLDGQLFLAFEYVDGGDLGRVLSRSRKAGKKLPLPVTLYVASELLKALQYVHSLQDEGRPLRIVHRDVSPGNVLVSRGGDVKLGDFGVAKATSRAGKTVAGVIKGNTRYMAPEQLTGAGVDARTDLYAVGMLLHTMVAGQHPLGDAQLSHLLPRILEGKIPGLEETAPDAPKKLAEVVRKATMPFATERYQSAIEMQLALLELANAERMFFDAQELATHLLSLFPEEDQVDPLSPPPVPSISRLEPMVAEAEGNPIPSEVPEESVFRTRAQLPPEEEVARPSPPPPVAEPPPPEPRRSQQPTVLRDDPLRVAPRRPRKTGATVIVAKANVDGVRKPKTKTRTSLTAPAPVPPELRSAPVVRKNAKPSADVTWLEGHSQAVAALSITSNGRFAVSAGHEGKVIVWNLRTRQAVRALRGHAGGVTSIDVDGDGTIAVSGGRDKALFVWDLESGLPTAKLAGHKGWIFSVSVARDGERILSAGIDTTIRLWHRDEPKPLRVFTGHEDAVNAIAFFPDGQRALSGGRDRTLRVWDLRSDKPERVLDGELESVRAVAVSPKGGLALVAGASPALRLWDVESGREVHRFEGHREGLAAAAFSRDGRLAASASYDGTVRLWDVEKGTRIATLEGHRDAVLAVAFSPDGTFVLTGGGDGKIGLWPRRPPAG